VVYILATHLRNNELSSFSWDGCPKNLHTINLWDNELISFEWDGCPLNLHTIYLDKVNEYSYKQYQMAMKIKQFYKKRHSRRKHYANIINHGCHNWVWSPKCKDGTIGIRPRLDIQALGIVE
jgi:hypothetical protein